MRSIDVLEKKKKHNNNNNNDKRIILRATRTHIPYTHVPTYIFYTTIHIYEYLLFIFIPSSGYRQLFLREIFAIATSGQCPRRYRSKTECFTGPRDNKMLNRNEFHTNIFILCARPTNLEMSSVFSYTLTEKIVF